MKSQTVRQKHDNGFTMVEMLVVLLIFICILALMPMMKGGKHTMYMKMEALRERLLYIQGRAMREFKDIRVEFQDTNMICENLSIDINMRCEGFVVFHANGNVDKAKTLHCSDQKQKSELVIQLGSGRMYVKK